MPVITVAPRTSHYLEERSQRERVYRPEKVLVSYSVKSLSLLLVLVPRSAEAIMREVMIFRVVWACVTWQAIGVC